MSCEKHLGLACLCENSAATQVIDRLQRELAEAKQEVDRLSAGLNSTTLRRETNIKDLERVTAERDAWQTRLDTLCDFLHRETRNALADASLFVSLDLLDNHIAAAKGEVKG